MPRALAAAAATALLALAGCGGGGGSAEDAERTVRDFAAATSAADGKKLCRDLVTSDYLEKATAATGDNAVDQCVKQIDRNRGIEVEVAAIKKSEVDGDTATVEAELSLGGATRPQTFELKKEDGRFKVDSGD